MVSVTNLSSTDLTDESVNETVISQHGESIATVDIGWDMAH